MATDPYHYPPDLISALIDTIPLLGRSKPDTIEFFRACGVGEQHLADLRRRVTGSRESINKFEIARTVLTRVNEEGDSGLGVRRRILQRVVEWEDFSTSWPDKAAAARGNVSRVREMVDKKDSFLRMQHERDQERGERLRAHREAAEEKARKQVERRALYDELRILFGVKNPRERGLKLEALLNRIFKLDRLGVRESFTLSLPTGQTAEQIDGLIELGGQLYIVEVKWWKDPLGVDGVGQHLVRVYSRAGVHGLIISASGFADTSVEQCRQALGQRTIVLAELHEIVYLLERDGSLEDWLRLKTLAASVDRNPLYRPGLDDVA